MRRQVEELEESGAQQGERAVHCNKDPASLGMEVERNSVSEMVLELEVARNKVEVAFRLGVGLHSTVAVLALGHRSLELSQNCSKKNHVKTLLGPLLLLKDTCERVYYHS